MIDPDTFEEIAHYHRCVAERAQKNSRNETSNDVERRASAGSARLHQGWADAIDQHLEHLTAEHH
jgi:hypothetical protein